jgi:hypothetical protein
VPEVCGQHGHMTPRLTSEVHVRHGLSCENNGLKIDDKGAEQGWWLEAS